MRIFTHSPDSAAMSTWPKAIFASHCTFEEIIEKFILKKEPGFVIDWSSADKEDYLPAMERSPVKNIEIKHLLKQTLTDKINDREVYMKGIDHSYYYEGYAAYKTGEL